MTDKKKKTRVLVVCTGNACRSQMAEAIWRHEAGEDYEVFSAGTHPAGVHPLARRVLEEAGIDTDELFSKSVFSMAEREYDLVITVCDDAKERCPVFPRAGRQLHWPFLDPVGLYGPVEDVLPHFRWTRDQIQQKIREFLASEKNAAQESSSASPS